jgi:hypothetical protein
MLSAILILIVLIQAVYASAVIDSTMSFNKMTILTADAQEQRDNLVSNPDFILFDNRTGLPTLWYDPSNGCRNTFTCTINSTTGWKDKTSFQISTDSTKKNTWLNIYGKGIDVNPNERYRVTFHMKLNNFATASQALVAGSNETSRWTVNMYCPYNFFSTTKSLEWNEVSCEIRIPQNTTMITPVLATGWSSQANKESVTLYDGFSIINMTGKSATDNTTTSTTKASTTGGSSSPSTNLTTQNDKPTVANTLCSLVFLQC